MASQLTNRKRLVAADQETIELGKVLYDYEIANGFSALTRYTEKLINYLISFKDWSR